MRIQQKNYSSFLTSLEGELPESPHMVCNTL
jgi:hypothetical protein